MNVWPEPGGELHIDPPTSVAGDRFSVRAEMDLHVGLTACSAEKSNGGVCKPIEFSVTEAVTATGHVEVCRHGRPSGVALRVILTPCRHPSRAEATEAFASLAKLVYAGSGSDEVLEAICRTAVDIIPGADHACISTLDDERTAAHPGCLATTSPA